MAFLTGGPYYDMIGRAGNNVGRRVKGKNVFSMRPSKSNKPATLRQSNQRSRFGLLCSWMAELGILIDMGFKNYDAKMSPMNACVSLNSKRNVVTGSAAPFSIDYTKVVLSRGKLTQVKMPDVATGTGTSVVFSWEANIGLNNASANDRMSFAVYDPMTDEFVVAANAADRSALTYEMLLPGEVSGHMVQVWMMVISDDGVLVGNSLHLGAVPAG